MLEYIPILQLAILAFMVVIRSLYLRRQGIKAIVFGETDKTDFFIIPIVLFFFYCIISIAFDLPLPEFIKKRFWNNDIFNIIAILICTISLIWFGITLKAFGKSFRVGIDEKSNEKLITNGTFSISRNPIYVAFIVFFLGIFITYSSIIVFLFLVILIILIHRQILREEEFLKKQYKEEYIEYCKKVRRYI